MGFNIYDAIGNKVGWVNKKSNIELKTGEYFVDDSLDNSDTDINISTVKNKKIADIKQQASELITATDWRLQRAKERDDIGVAGEKPKQVLAEREAIRTASNRAETEVNAFTQISDIMSFTWQVLPSDYPAKVSLTQLEFLRRFTPTERVTLKQAANKNPQIADYYQMLNLAHAIVLTDQDIIVGVNMMEQAGLLASGRAAEILEGDILND